MPSKAKSKLISQLQEVPNIKDRAKSFNESIKDHLKTNILDPCRSKITTLEDEKFELSNFTMDTNLNSGNLAVTREDTKKRYERIMRINHELKLLNLELESYQETYNEWF